MSTPVWARVLLGAGLVALCAASISHALKTPTVVPANGPAAEFSAERAMRHVRAIAVRPHTTGSAEHLAVLRYLKTEITALGLAPQIQDATGVGTRYAVAGRVRNVLVRVPGKSPGGPAVLLMSHYDGVPAGPAAADAGAGTAALLETVRALTAGRTLAHDVIVLFTDSEEHGLLGAAAFAREHPWAKDAAVVLNFEARGVEGPSLMFETGPGNLDVARALRRVPGARATSLSTAVYRRLPNDTDLSEMAILGLPAMNFAFIGDADRHHTTEDDATHLNVGSLQHHGTQALALARAFGDGELPRPRTADAVFFFAPAVGMVAYPEAWALPLAVVAVLLVLALAASQRRVERWLGSIAAGASAALVALLLAACIGYAVASALGAFHAAIGSGNPRLSGWYVASVAMFAVAIVMLSSDVGRKWFGPAWHTGTVLVWALVSLAVAVAVPGASFLFTWPVLFAAAARQQRPWSGGLVLYGLALFTAITFVVPTAYLMVGVALGLDAVGGVVLAVLSAMAAMLLSGLLSVVGGERLWRGPLGAAVAAAVLLGVGMVRVRTSSTHPASGVLVYATDADSGGAWLTGYATNGAGHWLDSTLSAARTDSVPVRPWVRRLARGRATISVRSAEAKLEAPTATILKDTVVERGHLVVLRIKPSVGAWSIGLQMDTGTVIDATVNGRPIDRSRYRNAPARWGLDFIAPPDTGFVLAITTPAYSTAVLGLSARVSGLPPLPGVTLPPRPAGVLSVQSGDVTVVYRRLDLMPRDRRVR